MKWILKPYRGPQRKRESMVELSKRTHSNAFCFRDDIMDEQDNYCLKLASWSDYCEIASSPKGNQ